ncbi:MAG: hypothetical protein IPI57_16065 [Candidatus Competibacteraceae bacterium]|nr:hypothetical protein [Candidatus Competibacteraceae bacterium]
MAAFPTLPPPDSNSWTAKNISLKNTGNIRLTYSASSRSSAGSTRQVKTYSTCRPKDFGGPSRPAAAFKRVGLVLKAVRGEGFEHGGHVLCAAFGLVDERGIGGGRHPHDELGGQVDAASFAAASSATGAGTALVGGVQEVADGGKSDS